MSAIADLLGKLIDAAKGVPGLRRDQKRMRILRDMLGDPAYEWRSIATLARSIGASEESTRDLLISIGARASAGSGGELWGLTSRVGTTGTHTVRPEER
jgi:hypothetical protein